MRLICEKCTMECDPEFPCVALQTLNKLYLDLKTESKTDIIKELRNELSIIDYEVADDLRELGERLISNLPELGFIRDYDVKIGYVRSYENKHDKGKLINADCRKVNGTYTAYLPFDFIVTFYEPNVFYMNDNQRKTLMLHELKHIGIGERGLRIENHDVEDFKSILDRFGIEWSELGQEVPDILADSKVKVGGGCAKGTKQWGKKK